MNSIRYSSRAEADLVEILDYSTDKWGEDQAISCLAELVTCFEQIAKMPDLGRACDLVHPGFRRIEQGSHVIFIGLSVTGFSSAGYSTKACCQGGTSSYRYFIRHRNIAHAKAKALA